LNIAAAVRGSRVGLTGGTGIGHTAASDVTSGGTLTATATTGDIGMVDGTVYSAGRSVSFTAARNVKLGRVEAGANPISVKATEGGISDITGTENENLIGGNINLVAATGIGEPGGSGDIDTAVTSIDAQTTTGGIFIDETDSVTLGPVTTGSGGGAIEVTSGGAMTVAQAVTTAGSGSIRLTTRAGNLQVNQAVIAGSDLSLDAAGRLNIAAAVSGGSVGLTSGTGIIHTAAGDVTSGGIITATVTANNISMADGTVYNAGGDVILTAANDVELGWVETGTDNTIRVTATGGAISDNTAGEGAGNENLVCCNIILTAANGIGGPGEAAESMSPRVTSRRLPGREVSTWPRPTHCSVVNPRFSLLRALALRVLTLWVLMLQVRMSWCRNRPGLRVFRIKRLSLRRFRMIRSCSKYSCFEKPAIPSSN